MQLLFTSLPALALGLTHLAAPATIDRTGAGEATLRLRAATPSVQRLIDDAARLSPSVRGLIDRLDCTDVFVYVQLTGSPQVKTGSTTFVATTPHGRYLRIQISAGLPSWARIHLLGHELQHAVEIADDPAVTSEAALRNLYGRIGHTTNGPDRFETTAALEIEAVVRGELLQGLKARKEW